jgi:hypothetical protein
MLRLRAQTRLLSLQRAVSWACRPSITLAVDSTSQRQDERWRSRRLFCLCWLELARGRRRSARQLSLAAVTSQWVQKQTTLAPGNETLMSGGVVQPRESHRWAVWQQNAMSLATPTPLGNSTAILHGSPHCKSQYTVGKKASLEMCCA